MQTSAPSCTASASSLEELLPVRPPWTRIGKHVINLVDGGEERTASARAAVDLRP